MAEENGNIASMLRLKLKLKMSLAIFPKLRDEIFKKSVGSTQKKIAHMKLPGIHLKINIFWSIFL